MKYVSVGYFLDVIFVTTFFGTNNPLTGIFCFFWIIVRLFYIASKILDDLKMESLKKLKVLHIIQLILVLVLIGAAMFIFSRANTKFNFLANAFYIHLER
jgi:uncharacterized MAPEG superfamily protein